MQNDPRSRILLLLQLLLKQTDEHHYATGADILRFWETHGIQTTRKNVYSDIQLLMDFGLDVICIKSTQNRYFVGSRLLELPELKLLVDAVESSHLITEKKSTALIEKLGHLTSRHNAALLNRPVYMDGTAKPDNEAVYYAIDAIQTAIHKQRAISFQYFEYTPKKEKVLKHKGYRYGFSPYVLIWSRDFYYAVGWSEKHGKLAQFRVDRMTAIQDSDAPYIADPSFDPASYIREIFGMYHDMPQRVTLLCENRTMRNIIDHFGEDVACGFSLILSIQAPPHGNGPRHAARPIPMVPSVSEGLVVINLYSRFFGKLSMKGTIALPHLMRPRPESTLVM